MAGGASDDTYTYDLGAGAGGPRRPDLADLGGASVVDIDPVPNQADEVHKGIVNELQRNAAGVNRLIGTAKIWIKFSAGSPGIFRGIGMGTGISSSTFTPTLTAPGQVRLSWAANVLPALQAAPEVSLAAGPGSCYGALVSGNPLAVDIFTFDPAGVAANLDTIVTLQ